MHKKIVNLTDRIESIEKNNAEYRERNNSNYSEVMRLLEDNNKLLNVLSNNLVNEFESRTQKMETKIISKFMQVETKVQEVSNESVRKTMDSCDAVSEELKNISRVIREVSALTEEQDKTISENIASMSIAMQKILKDLLALDEGNRLIIAKLLLKDMEI